MVRVKHKRQERIELERGVKDKRQTLMKAEWLEREIFVW